MKSSKEPGNYCMNLSERLTSVANKVGRGTSSENQDSQSVVVNIRCYGLRGWEKD